jgi:hypothetical protein
VFKSLLVIRSGACAVSKAAEPDFIPAFLNLTVGAGGVNLKLALASLAKITSGRGKGFWDKLTSPVHQRVAALQAQRQTADSHAEAAKRVSAAAVRLQELRREEEELKGERARLDSANRSWELSNLRDLQSRLNQGADSLAHRDGLNESAYQKLLELDRSAKEQEKVRDLAQAEAESLRREAQAAQARLEQCLAELENFPPQGTRAAWRGVIAGALGLAAGAFAFHLWGSPAAVIGAAAVGMVAWLIIGARAQVEELAKASDKAAWEKDRALELKKQKGEELRLADAQRRAAQTSIEAVGRVLQEALKPWGVPTVDMAVRKLADLENERRQLKTLLSDTAKTLGGTFADARAADAGLRQEISQIEAQLEAQPQSGPELSREEHEQRLVRCKKRLEQIHQEIMAREAEHKSAIKESSLLEGRLEGSPAALYAELEQKQLYIGNLEIWRQAAILAETAISGLLAGTGQGLKSCVKDAAPLFREMTAGRYTDVEMVKDNPLEAQALSVTHRSFGRKPAEWLSHGAEDLLWLALRMAWAKRAFPKGSLLVLDEPCLTLDPGRAAAAVAALLTNPVMAGWQIIILTKDERIAAACERAGAGRVELSAA